MEAVGDKGEVERTVGEREVMGVLIAVSERCVPVTGIAFVDVGDRRVLESDV
jgi:hypothetical protein